MCYSAQPSSNANAWAFFCPRKEAAGQVYGVFAGSMGEIEVYVAVGDEEAARTVVAEFFKG